MIGDGLQRRINSSRLPGAWLAAYGDTRSGKGIEWAKGEKPIHRERWRRRAGDLDPFSRRSRLNLRVGAVRCCSSRPAVFGCHWPGAVGLAKRRPC